MNLPRGSLLRKRVVADPATALATALDREVTGYLRLSPQDALLLEAEGTGIVTLAEGVPVVAYHTGTDRGGPVALGDMALPGPYGMALHGLDAEGLGPVHETEDFRVSPGMPAERLAGDPDLADRTRAAAPAARLGESTVRQQSAVEAFLEDEQKIRSLKERARTEARERAAEWGF
ncbi:MAG: hypothetical protein V5A24_01630 [Haloarculaceae archaeon]